MGSNGPTEIVSLPLIAAIGLKKCQLLGCFHALSDHPVLETFTHADDRANDDSIILHRNRRQCCRNQISNFY